MLLLPSRQPGATRGIFMSSFNARKPDTKGYSRQMTVPTYRHHSSPVWLKEMVLLQRLRAKPFMTTQYLARVSIYDCWQK
jgi:hypothetical protein